MRYFVPVLFMYSSVASAQIPGLEPEKQWSLGGYIKYMPSYSIVDDGPDRSDQLIHQRFNFEYRFKSKTRVNVGVRNRIFQGDSVEQPLFSKLVSKDYGYIDLSKNWYENRNTIANSQIDRLSLTHNKEDWQIRAGRFRVNWSMNTIWNPNDVFNTYSVYDFDYQEKPGTDAFSLSKQLGYASQFDVVYHPKSDSTSDSWALRYLHNQSGWDIQLIGGQAYEDNILGMGAAGDRFGAGLRAEISHFMPHNSAGNSDEKNNTVISTEADYSFGGEYNLSVRGAYLYVKQPQEPTNAAVYLNLPLTAKTLSFTRHTIYSELNFDTSALNKVSLAGIYYQESSYYLSLTDTYSLANDWQLIGIIQRYSGKDDSLFGKSRSTLLYLQIRWDF
ncbi:hypothetical protein [Vibrio sp. HN007]|uniref:hypothetical protein n=1 Tax=Vibrio iocasae TaxID=3098914 RepID=UPI0035D4CFCC